MLYFFNLEHLNLNQMLKLKKGKILNLRDLSDLFSVKDEENVSNNILNADNKNNEFWNGVSVENIQ